MFVDASAVVAILKRESGFEALASHLDSVNDAITSAIAIVEAVMTLGKQKGIPTPEARAEVMAFLERAGVDVVPLDRMAGDLAIDAHARFGRGSGHPARLNFGDCFAYAMAKQHGVPLLYKGDDFSQTDLA
jgi:ribonuclease VapC